jgi:hypothetical protein
MEEAFEPKRFFFQNYLWWGALNMINIDLKEYVA